MLSPTITSCHFIQLSLEMQYELGGHHYPNAVSSSKPIESKNGHGNQIRGPTAPMPGYLQIIDYPFLLLHAHPMPPIAHHLATCKRAPIGIQHHRHQKKK